MKLEDCPDEIQENFSIIRNVCNCWLVKNVDKKYLPALIGDKWWCVRDFAAADIDISYLPQMINDEDASVRYTVARRIENSYLFQMLADSHLDIRNIAKIRLEKETIKKIKCNICCKK